MFEVPGAPDEFAAAELAAARGLVDSIVQARKAIASLQSLEVRMLAAAHALALEQVDRIPSTASREREMPIRALAAEIGAATRVQDRTVQARMGHAAAVVERYPAAMRALGDGRIATQHLEVIHQVGMPLPAGPVRQEFERLTVAIAERETPNRLRALARVIAARLNPETAVERHRRARADRRVWAAELEDGMAELRAILPAELAHGIADRLDRIAHTIIDTRDTTDAADERSLNEVRADVFADLLLTGTPDTTPAPEDGPVRAHVNITVPVATLTGTSDEPGELAGYGPLDPDTCRHLAGTATVWHRIFLNPSTGRILTVDRYRPTPAQLRLLRVRDEHCRFPGCRHPAHRCDLDHTEAHAEGGPTCIGNLAHLCRRHHVMKHHTAWTVRQLHGGKLEWTSPQRRVYLDQPARTLTFVPDGDPPPF